MRKLLRVLKTFSDPVAVLADRLGMLTARQVNHRLRNGLTFRVRPGTSDTLILYDIFADKEYQPKDLPQFTPCPGWRVLDFGANIGAFSLQAAHAGAVVQAYEALPENFALFQENIRLNSAFTIHAHLGAVSDMAGRLTLHRKAGSSSAHWHTGEPSAVVDAIPVAQILGQFDRVDLLKCDIEGAEFPVFEAMTTEHFRMIDRIVMEYHDFQDFDHDALVRKFRRHGFEVWDRPKSKTSIYGLIFAEKRYLK